MQSHPSKQDMALLYPLVPEPFRDPNERKLTTYGCVLSIMWTFIYTQKVYFLLSYTFFSGPIFTSPSPLWSDVSLRFGTFGVDLMYLHRSQTRPLCHQGNGRHIWLFWWSCREPTLMPEHCRFLKKPAVSWTYCHALLERKTKTSSKYRRSTKF